MLTQVYDGFLWTFSAMASPCQVRVDTVDAETAARLGRIAEREAKRIETKFSRYRPDSIVSCINSAGGAPIEVDAETAALIDYAADCWALSDGRFDITSGVLRRVWRFDGSDAVPTRAQIQEVLPLVGWDKVEWRAPTLRLGPGMEIDLGGLGKEYAVDTAVRLIQQEDDAPTLVNFGGDLRVTGPRRDGQRWRVGLEAVDRSGATEGLLTIASGALTTSGDARRFLLKDGVRYSHLLDPRRGRPVQNCPRSVTVAAPTCLEAGVLSTLAMLHGAGAVAFLKREGVKAWWIA